MIKAPYDKDRNVDIIYETLILGVKKTITEKDDDFVLLYSGSTGTGKSNLMLWGYEIYDPDGCDPSYIGLDRQTHATALKNASKKIHPRFCADDEANVSKRDAMTKYNRDRIDLYESIRGLQILHAWCNPSVEMLDKPFIEERIKGLIFVTTKDVDRPRVYYYFTKSGILKVLKDYGNLKRETLKLACKKFAYYKGWFKKYEGKLLKPYLDKKDDRMNTKVEAYFESYGGVSFKGAQIGKEFGVDGNTITNWRKRLIEENLMFEDDHYKINGAGHYVYTENGKKLLEQAPVLLGLQGRASS